MYPNNYNDSYLNNLIDQLKNNSRLEEEVESGILEYKLRLDKCDANSLKKLESQMLWRINEGKLLYNIFRAYYVLGIQDDGQLGYMKTEIINNSIKNLKIICENANLKIDYIFKYKYDDNMISICVIKKTISKHLPEINIMLLGNTFTEKTTFLGNLCYNTIDDSSGKSKLLILKHKHEINSGKTSSIHYEIIGITNEKEIINYRNSSLDFNNSWDKIFAKSDYIINIFDTPGDIKYSKTTYNALFNINPDIVLLFTNEFDINTNMNLLIEKIKILIGLEKKFYLIFTKDDKNINKLQNELIKNEIIYDLTNFDETNDLYSNNIYYLILNNQSVESFNNFKKILLNNIIDYNSFKKINTNKVNLHDNNNNNDVCFNIYDIFDIPILNKNIIISGYLISGILEINKDYYLNNTKIKLINIHNKNIDCDKLYSRETGCLEIVFLENKININKFMTIHNNLNNIIQNNILISIKNFTNSKISKIIEDDIYIHSKYFSNIFQIEEKIEKDSNIILKLKTNHKIIINKINFNINSKCLIKIGENNIVGEIIKNY
jgi:hypothetical protein